jgi:signal transduction histidine kinase
MNDFSRGLLTGVAISAILFAVAIGALISRWRAARIRIRQTLAKLRATHVRRTARLQGRVARAQRLAEVGTLTGGLAHEIKNPLSTVQLNLQLLQEDFDPQNPSYSRWINRLSTVQRETSRLRDILDDFLRYAGKIELQRQPTDINQLLEQLADFFSPQAQQNRVTIRFKPAPQPLVLQIDPRLIKQAVLNLMINAVQAMPTGGELILSAREESTPSIAGDETIDRATPEAIIDVIDTGPGIPPETVEKIFDAYYSTKKGGTGLGLAMTRRIIEEHGGRIVVRSDVGKGTDFSIRLPFDPEMQKT